MMKPLPLCENFLGGHFKQWFESDDPIAKGDPMLAVSCYGIYNDLTDDQIQKLKEWVRNGFPHVCNQEAL